MPPKSKPPPTTTIYLPTSLTHPPLPLPPLIVFDLDYTLWPLWVDTHVYPPLKAASLYTATDRTATTFSFYREVPSILHALSRARVKMAVASRTATPDLARDMLKTLHVAPPPPMPSAMESKPTSSKFFSLGSGGLGGGIGGTEDTEWEKPRKAIELFDGGMEIYPKSKLVHFEILSKKTGIKYEDMLFFDDEARNREVESLGVTMRLVRDGVTWDEIEKGVAEWRRRREHTTVTK